MYIVVWKRMPQINEPLIVRIAVLWAGFLSIWTTMTGFVKVDEICVDEYQDQIKLTFDWQEIITPRWEDLPR